METVSVYKNNNFVSHLNRSEECIDIGQDTYNSGSHKKSVVLKTQDSDTGYGSHSSLVMNNESEINNEKDNDLDLESFTQDTFEDDKNNISITDYFSIPPIRFGLFGFIAPVKLAMNKLMNLTMSQTTSDTTYETVLDENCDCTKHEEFDYTSDIEKQNNELKQNIETIKERLNCLDNEFSERLQSLKTMKKKKLKIHSQKLQEHQSKILECKCLYAVIKNFEEISISLIEEGNKSEEYTSQIINEILKNKGESSSYIEQMGNAFNNVLEKYKKCKEIISKMRRTNQLLNEQILSYHKDLDNYTRQIISLENCLSDFPLKVKEKLRELRYNHYLEKETIKIKLKHSDRKFDGLRNLFKSHQKYNYELNENY